MKEEEHDNLRKHSKNQIINSEKKKKLMKKLARIKLNNKSRGNASFFDISAFYETKVRKLKLNNISLAKALTEQKQVSQTWYDTVVSLKEELHDSQESLLRLHYQVKENGDYEHVIQESVERRLRNIAEPLEASVTNSLKNVYGLVENLTKVKQLLTSALSFNNKEKLNFSRRSSHSMHGSRPPLSQNSKSPRKNVVHPMVEGHVLQPATIPIPRMTLEDRRRYRLQEQVEIGMEVIGELSTSENDSTSSDIDDSTTSDHQNVEEENTNCHHMEDANDDITTPAESSNLPSPDDDEESIDNEELPISLNPKDANDEITNATESSNLPSPDDDEESIDNEELPNLLSPKVSALDEKTTPESEDPLPEENHVASGSESPFKAKLNLQNSEESSKEETLKSPQKAEKGDHVCDEDPLEGSSWMHLKKGRSKKRKTKSGKRSLLRTSGLHFMPVTSSESEEEGEYVEIPVAKIKHGKVKGFSRGRPSRSKSSKVSVSNLDMLGSNISRRSKKSDSCSASLARESKEPTDLIDQIDEPRSSVLASFILNDSQTDTLLNENLDLKENHACQKHENPTTWENKLVSSTPPNSGSKLDPVVNLTCILDSPMELTECLTKEVLQSLAPFTEPSARDAEATSRFESENDDKNSVLKTESSLNSSTNMISGETSVKLQPHKNSVQECKKNKKYFKTTMKEKEMNEVVSGKKIETNLYNLSLMDASQVAPCLSNVGKENVPPSPNISSDDLGMKMKDISIVVKDIMKSPSPRSDADLSVPFYGFPNTSNQSKNTPIKSNKTTKEKSKKEIKRKEHASPLKKKPRKPKRRNCSENFGISIISSPSTTEDDDVWTPTKSNKRKTKYTKKSIASRKKLKNTDDSTGKNIPLSKTSSTADENVEIEPTIAKANDASNVEQQKTNPLCEIPIESNTLNSVPPDIFKDVNDIIRKHIKQEMDQINGYDNCEVIELGDSDGDNEERDPLAIEVSLDPFHARPRRATLKVQSFKEPSLNTKMRRSSMGKKVKKAPKKKSVKT